jgi:hypothetical protein
MTRFGLVVVLCGAWAGAGAGAASPDPKDLAVPAAELARAKGLVRQLASPAYSEREAATADLARMGRLARPALAAAAADPDPEVRARAARLLPRAEADELAARLDAFLADAQGKYKHDLPGWAAFRKQAGADDKARALYAAIAKPGSPTLRLLAALDRPAAEAGKAVADFRDELAARARHPVVRPGTVAAPPPVPVALPDIAALLLAESVVPYRSVPRPGQGTVGMGVGVIGYADSVTLLENGGTHAGPYRRIVAGWLGTREDPTELSTTNLQGRGRVGIALRSFPEYDPLVRRVVTTEGVIGYYRANALAGLVEWHGTEEVPYLKGLLGNDTLVTTLFLRAVPGGPNVRAQCQLRDVALALLIQQTGQAMKDYGFETHPGQTPNPTQSHSYGFLDDDKRAAAMAKFAWWQFKQAIRE